MIVVVVVKMVKRVGGLSFKIVVVVELLIVVVVEVVVVVVEVERVSRSECLAICFLGKKEIVEVVKEHLGVEKRLCVEVDM